MENAPLRPSEDDPDKKSEGKKKKKNAEALGVFAVDAEPTAPKAAAESIWDKLTFTKRAAGETVETTPLAQVLAEAEARRMPELSETEVEAESLSQSEQRFAERTIVEARQQIEPALSAETAEAAGEGYEIAAAEAVELFRSKVIAGGQPVEQAFTETLQSLDAETPEVPPLLNESASRAPAAEPSPDSPLAGRTHPASETIAGPAEASAQPETFPINQPPELAPEASADNLADEAAAFEPDEEAAPEATGAVAPPLSPRPPHLAAAEAANYVPPMPNAGRPLAAAKEVVPYYNNEDLVGAAFLGGLVGYFIGRRRGRIKAERKLKPVQKKLEKQVEALNRDIAFKEARIRQAARQQTRERQQLQRVERSARRDQHRIEALEANQLHGKKVSPERIGRVVVTAEDKSPGRPKKTEKSKKIEKIQPKPIDKRIETMSRAELLDLSEKVTVENTNLRQVYETHLVGEQGLRRLVSEYARGGDVQKALRAELVEHEIDFERDPLLRDRKRAAEPPASHQPQTLDSLLQKAGVLNQGEVREELAVLKARQQHQEQRHQQQQSRRRLLDVSMAAVIAVLTALVIMLLLRGQ
ncbi:MAG TPA: hypothetical protein VHC21_04760 [Candidatus Saccharimonadales bacterium]|nr:hypothetical protein [Candidatus Saccharimonadales bacterium]